MISVKWFGEMEFWAALIKVVPLVTFLVVGIVFLAGRFTVQGAVTGPSVITDNDGILPNGMLALVVITSGVIFAYAAVELVGTAAGETADPPAVMPRAINSVIFGIAVFYVGSLILLALLLPFTAYKAGDIMNFVVPILIRGWYAVRGRVLDMAKEREGITGNYPVYAETPLMDELLGRDATEAAKKAVAAEMTAG